ncbi:MAG: NADH-dependent flavin oxidoreductase [Deltaproteobacteria bacterium HGW-Deltaproteobacteria-12]|jgi:2,4-dienoyl-CoA reductase-like NADH-dependent reductase (Old Yellow Enzyme family)|nr:MAG: NADH-dependent flavin oxidoreductase [Deltaproteobacteria bacterium HGW-Deltaproteobacteria-12]
MQTSLPHLFSEMALKTLTLKNLLVRSATYEAKAGDDGRPANLYLGFYRRLAEGGVGLIVTCLAYPDRYGKLPRAPGVEDAGCLQALSAVPASIHKVGNGCKVALQIGHTGRQVPHIVPDGKPVAPSPVFEPYSGITPRELSLPEIETFIDKCADAIDFARRAGFDAVQLHAAHGWLLSSFLSPHTNRRTDIYGGSTQNRTRIMTEIISRAQKRVGDDFPVLVKMNACDYAEGGIELPEALAIGKILDDAGFAALEVSSGTWETITRDPQVIGWKAEPIAEARKRINTVKDEAYHREFARAFKKEIKGARVILVGGLKTPALMEEIIAGGDADLVSLSRALIREPDLPNRWRAGRGTRAACVSCNLCLETVVEKDGLRCAVI